MKMNPETSIAPPLVSSSRLTLEVVRSDESFDLLEQEWDTLAQCSASATIFQTFAWQRLWWKHFAHSGRTLYILVLRNDHEICGIAPCFLEQVRVFGRTILQRLRLIGAGDAFARSHGLFLDDGPSDFLDFLALPGHEGAVAAEFVDHILRTENGIHELELVNASPDSIARTYVIPALQSRGISLQASEADLCVRLAVPESMEAYFRQMGSSVRRRFSQAARAYHNPQQFSVRCVETLEQLELELPRLVELHQRRWNSMGFPGLFLDRRSSHFQTEIAKRFLPTGRLWFRSVYADGECVAARLGFQYRNRFYDYLSGIDASHTAARYRPGLGLLLAMIEEASFKGFDRVEFLRGDEQYKLDFSTDAANNRNYRITLPSRRTPWMMMAARVAKTIELLSFLVSREVVLLKIQRRVHGIVRAPRRYLKFRALRFQNKFRREGEREGTDD